MTCFLIIHSMIHFLDLYGKEYLGRSLSILSFSLLGYDELVCRRFFFWVFGLTNRCILNPNRPWDPSQLIVSSGVAVLIFISILIIRSIMHVICPARYGRSGGLAAAADDSNQRRRRWRWRWRNGQLIVGSSIRARVCISTSYLSLCFLSIVSSRELLFPGPCAAQAPVSGTT